MSSVSKLVATRAARIQTQWANAERWGKIMRDYSAEDVAKLQGSYPATVSG
jgi:isocitrate lyase